MDTSNPLAIIWHARVLSSGNPTLDTLAHWTTWLAVLSATLTLTLIFARAIQQHRPRHPSARLPRAFHLFLLLALAALLITSALRYEHKRLAHAVRRGTLDPARAGRDTEMRLGGFNAVDRRFNRSIAARAQAKADLMRRRFEPLWAVRYATTVSVEREKGPRERVQAKLLREAKEEVRAEKGRLPFFRPPDWPERKHSSWEYFDLLLDSPERFAWTAQWMVGLTAWMLYVSVECGRRRLAQPVAWSFVCLGGLVSLAMAQSLLFALLLIVPARQTGHITVPRSSLVYLEVLGLGMSLHVLKVFFQTDLAAKVLESNEELTEENFQLFLDSFKAFAPAFALSTMVMAHPVSCPCLILLVDRDCADHARTISGLACSGSLEGSRATP